MPSPPSDRDPPRGSSSQELFPSPNLPEPLADPLRVLRKVVIGLNWALATFLPALTVMCVLEESYVMAMVVFLSGFINVVWMHGVAKLLPTGPTDIIYLRSFRSDRQTGGIRTSIERVFDPLYRVSGIREPRRRMLRVVRFMSYLVFMLKYANPQYLNLEAGREWKGRLWRSLSEVRGVIIDIAEMTPAIVAEIRLCVKCVGMKRILFVVRDSEEPEAWLEQIRQLTDSPAALDDISVAAWGDGKKARQEFEKQAEAFRNRLPRDPAGLDLSARVLAEQMPEERFKETNTWLIFEIIAGVSIGIIAGVLIDMLIGQYASYLLLFFFYLYLGSQYRSFRRNCGSPSRLKIAARTIRPAVFLGYVSGVIALMVALLMPSVEAVHAAAARMKSSNNLKQIGLEMHNFNDANGRFPGVNRPMPPFQHPVSWRVLLLPYLEYEQLYRMYRFDEPWDGPNNIKLLSMMPRVYEIPPLKSKPKKTPIGHTYYRVFASRPGVTPSAMFVDGQEGPTMLSMSDGTSNTLLVVEAAESVPWTMPEALEYGPDLPLPKLGGHFRGGFNALLGDTSVRFIRGNTPEDRLRAWITKDGNETIPLD